MLRTMILLLIVWAVVIFLGSCSTIDNYNGGGIVVNDKCTTRIELRNGTTFEYPIDLDNLVRAEQGCVDHYGENSCLVRFIKTGKQSYWAICGGHK